MKERVLLQSDLPLVVHVSAADWCRGERKATVNLIGQFEDEPSFEAVVDSDDVMAVEWPYATAIYAVPMQSTDVADRIGYDAAVQMTPKMATYVDELKNDGLNVVVYVFASQTEHTAHAVVFGFTFAEGNKVQKERVKSFKLHVASLK